MDSQSDETEAHEGLFIVHGLLKSERTLHDANIELGGCLDVMDGFGSDGHPSSLGGLSCVTAAMTVVKTLVCYDY
jgi:hypothetical protein